MAGHINGTRRRVAASASLAAIVIALGGAAAAQDGRERIVVTTMRTSADWLDRADGVARISEDEIERVNADHPQELLNRAPGVMIHRNSGAEHLTAIRSPVLTAGAGAGSFLFLEDGVPLRSAGFGNVNGLFESTSELASSIEIVRGPGSVLYGSNAVHGIINIMTPVPNEDRTTIEISASTLDRNKGLLEYSRGDQSGGFYAGVSLLDEGGWRDASDVGEEKLLMRWDERGVAWSAETSFAFVNLNQETAGFAQGDDIYKDSIASRINLDENAYRDAKAARIQSRLTFNLRDDFDLVVTPYARWNDMEFRQHFLQQDPLEESGHWSVGSLATGYWQARDDLGVVFGADVERTDGYLVEFQELPTQGPFITGTHYDYEIVARTVAVYGDVDYALTPLWSIQAGVRAEHARYDYDNLSTDGGIGRYRRVADRTDEYNTVTPKVALLRHIGESSVAYARYSRGARAPQTSDVYRLQDGQIGPGNVIDVEIEPETLDSFEIGWRGTSQRLTWDLAAFVMQKEHFFFRDADRLNVPDGETSHQGVEAQVTAPLGSQFELTVAGAYAEHKWEFDRPRNNIVDGNYVDEAPKWLGNTVLRWMPTDAFDVEAEWVHVGEYFTDEGNTVSYPGHDVFNLRATWEPSDGTALFMIVRNATNTDYAERADFAFGNERYFPGEDRAFTFGIRKDL